MNRLLGWLAGKRTAIFFLGSVALAASILVARLHLVIPATGLSRTASAQAAERGRRLATIFGCFGCHGQRLQGQTFPAVSGVGKLDVPNLTLAVPGDEDADLERAIRNGIGADGRQLRIMPSSAYAHLGDAEVADLIVMLRRLKPEGQALPIGNFTNAWLRNVPSEATIIRQHDNPPLRDFGRQFEAGRRIARACVECHGPALQGGGPFKAPDLSIAAAYEPKDFARLMLTGKAVGGRELKVMSNTARSRFSVLSVYEITALHDYLKARAAADMR